MTFAQLCSNVRADLAQAHRYAHCVRVARLAERLAMQHGEATADARLAGMLHDLARLYSNDRLLAECRARSMPVAEYEVAHPMLLHARLGARLASERYDVTNASILSAIAKHTTGDPQMSRLDTILYLADSLEPGRSYEGRERLEALAFLDLGQAYREVLLGSVDYCRRIGVTVAPPTLEAIATLDPPH